MIEYRGTEVRTSRKMILKGQLERERQRIQGSREMREYEEWRKGWKRRKRGQSNFVRLRGRRSEKVVPVIRH